MDARLFRLAVLASALSSLGATYSSPNFVVTAPTAELAREVAQKAESCRVELAQEWLGTTLKNWFRPCQVTVQVGQIGAGGETKFTFAAGQVFGWNMRVQGTAERILDSVIPHEVSHTIFASHFRRPLPRWADEGAATLVEHESERSRQDKMLRQVFQTPQRIPLRQLLEMKEYPSDMSSVLTLYAEGYSLAEYLVQSGRENGKKIYLSFLQDGHEHGWQHAIRTHYGVKDVSTLEQCWSDWVVAGSPPLYANDGTMVADAAESAGPPATVVRSQSPDTARSAPMTTNSKPSRPLPIARGEFLEAPAPQRNVVDNRAAAESSQFADPIIKERRLEGRERLINEGWQTQPSTGQARIAAASNGESHADAAGSSGARKRFESVKRQGRELSRVLESDRDDPFDERPAVRGDEQRAPPDEFQN